MARQLRRPQPGSGARRHGRRPIRSSITGPSLVNPDARVARFEIDARAALEVLQQHLGDELSGVNIGFATVPLGSPSGSGDGGRGRPGSPDRGSAGHGSDAAGSPDESQQPLFYSVDRSARTITLYRMPIQRAGGLHQDDAEHRALFVGHCVYRAVCDYLGREPWDLLPGYFDHY